MWKEFCWHNCITFNTFWAPFLTNTFIVRNAQLSSKSNGFECYPKPNAVQYWFCLNWGWLSAFRCTLKYRQYVTYCTHTPVGYGLSVVSYNITDILILIYILKHLFLFRVCYFLDKVRLDYSNLMNQPNAHVLSFSKSHDDYSSIILWRA